MIVYFNGFRMLTNNDSKIAQTKQVNSLFDLSSRQTNITNAIDFPKVGQNIVAMKFLGISGNNSDVPYVLNSVSMFSDEGDCFIYNGRCVVLSTSDTYKVQFIDGNVDLYKAMGNDKIGVLDLTEIKHKRTPANVVASFAESFDKPYKYIVADYNGNMTYPDGSLNCDYLVPAVKASFLWDSIFSNYGFTYSGNFFDTDDFKKLWLTYPSGAEVDDSQSVTIFKSEDFYFKNGIGAYKGKGAFMRFNSAEINDLGIPDANMAFPLTEAGTYTFRVFGTLFVSSLFASNPANYKISIGKNYTGNITIDTDASNYSDWQVIAPSLKSQSEFEFDVSVNMTVEAGDIIYLMIKQDIYVRWGIGDLPSRKLGFEIKKINDDVIDFSKAFQDLGVKEFFNEITNRHALVPIRDKYTNNYWFYTLDELLKRGNSYDWSNKLPTFKSEVYLYDSYEQRNYFRLKYDAKDVDYNDGYIQVNNSNLSDKMTAYQSALYSPESATSELLGVISNVYKLWNKEIKDNGDVNYKTIDKRFFFIAYNMRVFDGVLKSEIYNTTANFTAYPKETFNGLDFPSVISKFYKNSSVLLNRAVVKSIEIMLNDNDISEIDLSKQVYLKQFGSYFLINKINNYLSSKIPTTVELVQLGDFIQDQQTENVIDSVYTERLGGNKVRVHIFYNKDFFVTPTINVEFLGVKTELGLDNNGEALVILAIAQLLPTMRVKVYSETPAVIVSSEIHSFKPNF